LGNSTDPRATQAIAGIITRNADQRDIIDAALTSINDRAGDVLHHLLADSKWAASPQATPVLSAIVGQIVRQRRDADLNVLIHSLHATSGASRGSATRALLKALSKVPPDALTGGGSPQLAELQQLRKSAAASLVRDARKLLEQDSGPADTRAAAIENLAFDSFANTQPLLERLLSPQEPATIHSAVFTACAEFSDPAVADLVLAEWDQYAPAQRLQATDLLLRRKPWAVALLQYLKDNEVAIATLDPGHIARLDNYPDEKIRQLARSLRGQHIAADRQQVFNEYRDVALAGGDAAKGRAVFSKRTAQHATK
jgi:hypothetical protein